MQYEIFEKFDEIGVIPVPAVDAVNRGIPLAESWLAGSIRLENLSEYLQKQKINAVRGSWMSKRAMIADGQLTEIRRIAKEASIIVKQVRRNNS